MYGTLTAFSRTSSFTGRIADTPGNLASSPRFDPAICTLMPLRAPWYWARTVPPAAWICGTSASWLALSWPLIWFFSEPVSLRPASACA